jgi:hypothetical protein
MAHARLARWLTFHGVIEGPDIAGQRQVVDRARRFHARHFGDAVEHLAGKTRCVAPACGDAVSTTRIVSTLRGSKPASTAPRLEAAGHQPGARQQHHQNRDFAGDEPTGGCAGL